MELAQGQIGPEVTYSFKFEGGKLVAQAAYKGAELETEHMAKYDALKVVDALIDALEKTIPGDQTAIAQMLKMAVKGVAA